MGDADWLKESGLNWGWDDCYPEFRKGVSGREHWKSRDYSKRTKVTSEEIENIAKELIDVKKKIAYLAEQEKILKSRIFERMPKFGWIPICNQDGNFIVERAKSGLSVKFDRAKAFKYIAKEVNSEFAASVIDECSSRKVGRETIYVRYFPSSRDLE